MALDLGLTTYQLLSALDGLAPDIQSRRRLDDAIDRALAVPAGGAAFRTAAVGRRPYIAARTGPEGLLGSQPPPQVPQDWTALSVDGSHIDVDRHLPLRCHLINLGGCAITYGQNHGCQLFNEPTLAVDDADLYLRSPDDARGETLIAGPLLGALRTVREVERLADAVENLPDDRPVLALLDGTLAFWDLQRGNYPRYVAHVLIAERLQPALARLRAARPPTAARWPWPPTRHDPAPPRSPAPRASCSASGSVSLCVVPMIARRGMPTDPRDAGSMPDRNFANGTLFHGDNLDFLRGVSFTSACWPIMVAYQIAIAGCQHAGSADTNDEI